MKIRILEKLAPFFMRIAATGKAPYKGPAAAEPTANAMTGPFKPEPGPMNFMSVSRGTQTSIRPSNRKMGGTTRSMVRACSRSEAPALGA